MQNNCQQIRIQQPFEKCETIEMAWENIETDCVMFNRMVLG